MQNAALIKRPLRRSPGCCVRGSTSGDNGVVSAGKLNRRNRSLPDDARLAIEEGEEKGSDGSDNAALAPGMLAKYEGASLSTGCVLSASVLGVALVASEYASSFKARSPGPVSTGSGWSSGTCLGLAGSVMMETGGRSINHSPPNGTCLQFNCSGCQCQLQLSHVISGGEIDVDRAEASNRKGSKIPRSRTVRIGSRSARHQSSLRVAPNSHGRAQKERDATVSRERAWGQGGMRRVRKGGNWTSLGTINNVSEKGNGKGKGIDG